LLGSVSVNVTFFAGLAPAGAGLLTTMLKLTSPPIVNVPPSGVLTIDNCGGTQFNDPESVALNPPSAVASATGFGCDWQAAIGVGPRLVTVTVAVCPAG